MPEARNRVVDLYNASMRLSAIKEKVIRRRVSILEVISFVHEIIGCESLYDLYI